jgi:hypothetical protein
VERFWEKPPKINGEHDSSGNEGDLENVANEQCKNLGVCAKTNDGEMLLDPRLLLYLDSENKGVHGQQEQNEYGVAVNAVEDLFKVILFYILILHWNNGHLNLGS